MQFSSGMKAVGVAGAVIAGLFLMARSSQATLVVAPGVISPEPLRASGSSETAVFAGGCFWGIDAVYRRVKGVTSVSSGYTGGKRVAPDYAQVSSGTTGHTEAVQVIFDPAVVSYSQLLQIFFSVHDPTQLNRQGPDRGSQYRSAVFHTSGAQRKTAEAYLARMKRDKTFGKPIVTQFAALEKFWPAEEYHQNYFAQHPNQPYIVINDAPKVALLKKRFSSLYREPVE